MKKQSLVILGIIALVVLLALIYVGVFVRDEATDELESLPFEFGQEITVEGTIVCLPHRDQSGPQTLECALGLKKDDDTFFGLKNAGNVFRAGEINTGDKVRVTGSADERDPEGRYAIVAVIDVETIEELGGAGENATSTGEVSPSSEWKTYTQENPAFSISYPSSWQFGIGGPKGQNPDMWWGSLSQADGENFLTIYSPIGYQDGTNFRNARVTVGRTNDPKAAASCGEILENVSPEVSTAEVTINDVVFTKIESKDAAAGGRYETTSYRRVHDGYCYAIEALIAYSAIEMYGEESGVEEFNRTEVQNTLETIVQSFRFQE